MGRKASELNALAVSRLTSPGFYSVGGVSGLALNISSKFAKSWILRIRIAGKRRDIGLGGYPSVTLAGAREKARAMRELVESGVDPIDDRRAKKAALAAERAKAMTFAQCVAAYLEAHGDGWKSTKHRSQWESTLTTYAGPVIGNLDVSAVDTGLVLKVLEPIWKDKTETATRLRGRIESVLAWATTRGYRTGENPARWKGHLDTLLAAPSKIQKVVHHAALPFAEVGAFMSELAKQQGFGARALELAILTAARSGEVRGATWEEFDLGAAVWTIPASRMKAGKEHRVPLSDKAVELLKTLTRIAETDVVFPGVKGQPLSDMSLTAVLRRMERGDLTVHGFRSSFRDWAGETTAYPREVIEHALAHQLQDKAEAAYARGTLFDKRRRLMADWARYCATIQVPADNVVTLRKSS
jgi:integrase